MSRRIGTVLTALLSLLLVPATAGAAVTARPLFAGQDSIRLTIRGPISQLARSTRSRAPQAAILTVAGPAPETLAITLAPRGITRLKRDVCQFPPLRVEFPAPPPAGSLFAGQRRLKLVTHCRSSPSFQQHLLLEYAAYRLYNVLTEASFRVRLAAIDYVDDRGATTSRLGFFIEDHRDLAQRNGMQRPEVGDRIATSRLSAPDSARLALFEYMIGNLDWSIHAGPPGERCCHNSRLIARSGPASAELVAVPYDFDFSGLVDAPYAVPPDEIPVASVRSRHYRGYCRHNAQVPAAAAELRAARPALAATLASVPLLEERTRRKAADYLDGFFRDIADEAKIRSMLRTCI